MFSKTLAVVMFLAILPVDKPVPEKKMSLPDAIEFVRPSVVQISIQIDPPADPRMPAGIHPKPIHVLIGSGFLVSEDGYAITARHVVHGYQAIPISSQGTPLAGKRTLTVGLAFPNFQRHNAAGTPTLSVRTSFKFIECEVVDDDEIHDIALLKLKVNPFTDTSVFIKTPTESISYLRQIATLSSAGRPTDGEPIAVSGYPLNQNVLITTSGSIASAWGLETFETQKPGVRFPVTDMKDFYVGDIHVNGGNSGGPVYSVTSGSVLGVCRGYDEAIVIYGDKPDGEIASVEGRPLAYNSGLALIIPVNYVVDLLKKNNVNTTPGK